MLNQLPQLIHLVDWILRLNFLLVLHIKTLKWIEKLKSSSQQLFLVCLRTSGQDNEFAFRSDYCLCHNQVRPCFLNAFRSDAPSRNSGSASSDFYWRLYCWRQDKRCDLNSNQQAVNPVDQRIGIHRPLGKMFDKYGVLNLHLYFFLAPED